LATLKDISAELGLSVATVSRALNGFPEVNVRTRRQVEEAAKRLNYRPNRLAQKLQSGRSGMVGMIVRPDPKSPADRSFVEIMMGLSQELAVHDIDMVFQVAVDSDPVFPYKRLVEKNTVDGFILNAPRLNDRRFEYLRHQNIPFVVHGRGGGEPDYPYFDIDNAGVGAASVNLMADLGHTRIALLNGPGHWGYAAQRRTGVAATLKARDLNVPQQFLVDDDRDPNFSYRAALGMLSGRYGPRPTAIICASTIFASGVYRAAKDLGMAVPSDLSIIAHDDAVPELRAINFEPSLTVTRAPLRNACRPLAQCLIGAMNGEPLEALQMTAKADLIIRQSTGPVPRQEMTPWT
jgi:LacI family transcriptional regulator